MDSTKQVKYGDRPVVLIGFMGCGKSVLGQKLAARLGLAFIDLDQAIVRQEAMSIPEIFKKHGETGFRKRETSALKAVLQKPAVVAAGGGLATLRANRELLKKSGAQVIWLNPPWNALWKRLAKCDARKRPLLWDEAQSRPRAQRQVREIWSKRKVAYRQAATAVLRVRAEESISESLRRLRKRLGL